MDATVKSRGQVGLFPTIGPQGRSSALHAKSTLRYIGFTTILTVVFPFSLNCLVFVRIPFHVLLFHVLLFDMPLALGCSSLSPYPEPLVASRSPSHSGPPLSPTIGEAQRVHLFCIDGDGRRQQPIHHGSGCERGGEDRSWTDKSYNVSIYLLSTCLQSIPARKP